MSANACQEPKAEAATPTFVSDELEDLTRNIPSGEGRSSAYLVAGTYLSTLLPSAHPIEAMLIIPEPVIQFRYWRVASSEEWEAEDDLASEFAAWDAASDEALASFEAMLE